MGFCSFSDHRGLERTKSTRGNGVSSPFLFFYFRCKTSCLYSTEYTPYVSASHGPNFIYDRCLHSGMGLQEDLYFNTDVIDLSWILCLNVGGEGRRIRRGGGLETTVVDVVTR